MTRPLRRAKTIARLTGDKTRVYYIEVRNGQGLYKHFWSYSRNARKHLRDNVPNNEIGARCIVYRGEADSTVVSSCAYQEDGTIKYIVW